MLLDVVDSDNTSSVVNDFTTKSTLRIQLCFRSCMSYHYLVESLSGYFGPVKELLVSQLVTIYFGARRKYLQSQIANVFIAMVCRLEECRCYYQLITQMGLLAQSRRANCFCQLAMDVLTHYRRVQIQFKKGFRQTFDLEKKLYMVLPVLCCCNMQLYNVQSWFSQNLSEVVTFTFIIFPDELSYLKDIEYEIFHLYISAYTCIVDDIE